MTYDGQRSFDLRTRTVTVQWYRINPTSLPESALYNVFVLEDGAEIDSESDVEWELVLAELRLWRRRAEEVHK